MRNYIFQGRPENATSFYDKMTPNVTWFSHEQYDYFVRNRTDGQHIGKYNFFVIFLTLEG